MEAALVEQLAAIEHERWADWQRYLHSQCHAIGHPTSADDPTMRTSLLIPAEKVERWERQINTPYDQLSEREKESDREQVRRYLHLVRPK